MIRLSRTRMVVGLAVCVVLCAVAILVAPFVGKPWIDPWRALGQDGVEARILALRLPRAVAAAIAGAGLATAGTTLQALVRNPLADPYTLGIAGGASLGAVLTIQVGLAVVAPLAAFIGAAAAAALVYRFARVGRSLPPATLLLAGVTVSLMCSAFIMVIQAFADWTESYKMARWFMGGLDATTFDKVLPSACAMPLGLGLMFAVARDLNALSANEDTAASVGVSVLRATSLAYGGAAIAIAAAVALAGPVGFVGLLVPHVLRALLGPDHRLLLPASAFAGGAFVVACDVLARTLVYPRALPVGVITALMGGPFFLILLVRSRRGTGVWG
ncbi:MAG: iron ABC transporter permease [Deltaproteobacteria bacterium]|nr:iron ABC transporter permease [Deltaproteobacteria bacterium]